MYFEKAPFSYKVGLDVDINTGEKVAQSIAEIFHNYPKPVIVFSDIASGDDAYPVSNITAVRTFAKIIVK